MRVQNQSTLRNNGHSNDLKSCCLGSDSACARPAIWSDQAPGSFNIKSFNPASDRGGRAGLPVETDRPPRPSGQGSTQGEQRSGHGWPNRLLSFGFNQPQVGVGSQHEKVYLQALLIAE